MDYKACAESYTEEEAEILSLYFSNLDQPVFAIQNLPEVVKGAMFARYSRYAGGLRTMFLEEFAADLDHETIASLSSEEADKAAGLYERVFVGYGDDSIAQVGGAHLACEYASNILTKVLQRGRLAAYLEQSTRYIAYNQPLSNGAYRFYQDDKLGQNYRDRMTELFQIYSDAIEPTLEQVRAAYPLEKGQSEAAWRMSVKAKALDLLRGLLPAASLSHVGIFASGQAYENLIMRMLANPLPESQDYAKRMLKELQTVIPSFLSRIERPDRGGEWIRYFEERNQAVKELAREWETKKENTDKDSVMLIQHRGEEDDLLVSGLFEAIGQSESETRKLVAGMLPEDKERLFDAIIGERKNRRHRPSRGFEAVSYRFEIVSDYGAFRDLQRHRMLTCQWQTLSPDLGADIPEELPESVKESYEKGLELSRATYEDLVAAGKEELAPYALSLGYRIRYILDLNAREAMQLTELRSGAEGHPSYRAVAQEMHNQIRELHPNIGKSFEFVDHTVEPRLERILSEIRTEKKRKALAEKENN